MGVNIPAPVAVMLVLFSTAYNQETATDFKGRWVSSQPVKHGSIISSMATWYSYCRKNSNIYEACSLSAGFYHDFLPSLHSSGMLGGKSLWLYLATASFFPNPGLEAFLKSSSAHDGVHLVILFLRDLLLGTVNEIKVTYHLVFQVWQLLL